MFLDALITFLKKWIFKDTRFMDSSLSFLNRHYALHSMGTESFYKVEDCHKLIILFDLYIELLSNEYKKYYIFIPDDNLAINLRREYYLMIIENNPSLKEMQKIENLLLKENRNFIKEKNPPRWSDLQMNAMIDTLMLMSKIKNRPKKEPKSNV